jgi:hypothetical protein
MQQGTRSRSSDRDARRYEDVVVPYSELVLLCEDEGESGEVCIHLTGLDQFEIEQAKN